MVASTPNRGDGDRIRAQICPVNQAAPAARCLDSRDDVWPESRSEWLARHFPNLSRLWNGSPPETSHPCPRPGRHPHVVTVTDTGALGANREDTDVRPVDASNEDAARVCAIESGFGQRSRVPLRSAASSRPASIGSADAIDAVTERELPVELSSVDASPESPSAVDGRDADAGPMPPARVGELGSSSWHRPPRRPRAPSRPRQCLRHRPWIALRRRRRSPPTKSRPQSRLSRRRPRRARPSHRKHRKPHRGGADAPAAATPSNTPPPAPPSPRRRHLPQPHRPASPTPCTTGGSRLDRPSRQDQARRSTPRRRRWPLRSRAGVSSAFCSLKRSPRPLASPQFPPPTFPATYCVDGQQYPKPYPVLAAPQTVEFTPTIATHAEKKPCVLTAWLQKLKSCGKGSGCSGCHHGHSAPCCSGCTCHTAKTKSVMASPQASLASPQGNAGISARSGPSLQMAPIGSTGPQPGDVAEEGKLFERVSFDRFDESPQR